MNEASVAFSVADEDSLSLQVNGEWRMETDVPATETMLEQLSQHPSIFCAPVSGPGFSGIVDCPEPNFIRVQS